MSADNPFHLHYTKIYYKHGTYVEKGKMKTCLMRTSQPISTAVDEGVK